MTVAETLKALARETERQIEAAVSEYLECDCQSDISTRVRLIIEKALERVVSESAPQPIETAPKTGAILGARFVDGVLEHVCGMRHNGISFYTLRGDALPQMTHWTSLPASLAPESKSSEGR